MSLFPKVACFNILLVCHVDHIRLWSMQYGHNPLFSCTICIWNSHAEAFNCTYNTKRSKSNIRKHYFLYPPFNNLSLKYNKMECMSKDHKIVDFIKMFNDNLPVGNWCMTESENHVISSGKRS